MITITQDYTKADAITHNGIFHADEIMATAILAEMNNDLVIARLNAVPVVFEGVVYDIGGGVFDHHQTGGNGIREDGVPYASAGLIWRAYGKEILGNKGVLDPEAGYRFIDRILMETIDGYDNGKDFDNSYRTYDISRMLSALNPTWLEENNTDDRFLIAVDLATKILDREIEIEKSRQQAEDIVSQAIEEAKDGYMELKCYVPWKDYVVGNPKTKDIDYVMFPSVRGGYNVQAVPIANDPMSQKRPFPQEWRGKKGDELALISGVKGAVFAHQAGFFAVADSRESAIQMIIGSQKHDIQNCENIDGRL